MGISNDYYMYDINVYILFDRHFPRLLISPYYHHFAIASTESRDTLSTNSTLSTQLSRLDFPPDRIIIAHQFRASSLRCDLIVCPRMHNSLQPHRYRGPLDAAWINVVRVRKYSLAVNRIPPRYVTSN